MEPRHPSYDAAVELATARHLIPDEVARAIAAGLRALNLGGRHVAAIVAGEHPLPHHALAEIEALTAHAPPELRRELTALRGWALCDGTRYDPEVSDAQILAHQWWLYEQGQQPSGPPPDDWSRLI